MGPPRSRSISSPRAGTMFPIYVTHHNKSVRQARVHLPSAFSAPRAISFFHLSSHFIGIVHFHRADLRSTSSLRLTLLAFIYVRTYQRLIVSAAACLSSLLPFMNHLRRSAMIFSVAISMLERSRRLTYARRAREIFQRRRRAAVDLKPKENGLKGIPCRLWGQAFIGIMCCVSW